MMSHFRDYTTTGKLIKLSALESRKDPHVEKPTYARLLECHDTAATQNDVPVTLTTSCVTTQAILSERQTKFIQVIS